MTQTSGLTLECLAIGSLPHNNPEKAMEIVEEIFTRIPFWPQLANCGNNEDMIIQFLDNMPSYFIDESTGKSYLETESDKFFEDMEQFFDDFQNYSDKAVLSKYAINRSISFPKFLEIIEKNKPKFAKGQIVGPFTLSTTLVDKYGKCAFYDETLREIITRTLALKALWQIDKIKSANPDTVPVIFIDEPSISQLGTSAFLTVSEDEVIEMVKFISDLIKQNGGVSAIHCCGKCDWTILINSGVDIINLDAYAYAQNLSLFHKELKEFLDRGGKIAWGIVPTLDSGALEKADFSKMVSVFDNAVKYLTKKGIDEKIIIENSLLTPSCGAGGLSEELAEKAMRLVRELSDSLKERYYGV